MNCNILDGTDGNTREFFATDGTKATVTAWGSTGAGGLFENAFLGHYSSGLGVTNRGEGNGDNGRHTMDNVNHLDIMAFFFSEVIDVTSIRLNPFNVEDAGTDTDITAWIATVNDALPMPSLDGLSLVQIDATYGAQNDNEGNGSSRTAMFNPGLTGNFLLLAGHVDEFLDNTAEDGMKVKKLFAETRPPLQIPEPGSMATFAIGLIGLGFMARRRRSRA